MNHRQHNRTFPLLAALLACVLALPVFGSIPRFADSANYSVGNPAAGIVSAPQPQGAPRALTLSLSLDRMSYWTLPGIDQRIGFVDVDVTTGVPKYYYYLTDQVDSVWESAGQSLNLHLPSVRLINT